MNETLGNTEKLFDFQEAAIELDALNTEGAERLVRQLRFTENLCSTMSQILNKALDQWWPPFYMARIDILKSGELGIVMEGKILDWYPEKRVETVSRVNHSFGELGIPFELTTSESYMDGRFKLFDFRIEIKMADIVNFKNA